MSRRVVMQSFDKILWGSRRKKWKRKTPRKKGMEHYRSGIYWENRATAEIKRKGGKIVGRRARMGDAEADILWVDRRGGRHIAEVKKREPPTRSEARKLQKKKRKFGADYADWFSG